MVLGSTRSAAPQLTAAVLRYRSIDHLEGLTRCAGSLSELALQCGDPHLAAGRSQSIDDALTAALPFLAHQQQTADPSPRHTQNDQVQLTNGPRPGVGSK